MKISAILRTSEFRGDHSADITRALDASPDTTLGELVLKFLSGKRSRRVDGEASKWEYYRGAYINDVIEFRVIGEGVDDGEVLGVTPEGEAIKEGGE